MGGRREPCVFVIPDSIQSALAEDERELQRELQERERDYEALHVLLHLARP